MANTKVSALAAAAAITGAEIIPLVQSGVNVRSTTGLARGVVTPQMYGATGNGIASDGAFMQLALNAAVALGVPLFIPPGIYKFAAGTYLNPPSNSVIIAYPGAVLTKPTDEAIPIIYVPSGNPSRIRIRGLTFQYTAATTAVTGGANAAIYLIGCTDVIIEDCLATGKFYVTYNISEGQQYTFKDCKASGFVNRGFYVNAGQGGTTSGTIKHVKVLDCVADGLDGGLASNVGRYGFDTNAFGTGSGDNILIDGCFALGVYGHGFSASEHMTNVRIVNCHVITTAADNVGIIVQLANTFRADRNLVEGCTVTGGFIGIEVTESDYTHIIGCSVRSCIDNGVYVHNSKYVNFVGCHSNSNGGRGFNVDATGAGDSTRVSFVSCVANSNTGYGIFAGAGVTYPRATNCDTVGNTAGTISLADGTAITGSNS